LEDKVCIACFKEFGDQMKGLKIKFIKN